MSFLVEAVSISGGSLFENSYEYVYYKLSLKDKKTTA